MLSAQATHLRIRAASRQDAVLLHELQAVIYHEDIAFVGEHPPSVDWLKTRLSGLRSDQSLYLVAAATGRPVAWLELHRLSLRRLSHVAVLTLAVAPDFRRQGLASRLLEASYHWAQEMGVSKISLNVRAGNQAAISLYEQQGFVSEGRERFHIRIGQIYEDNILMAKYLGVQP